MPLGDAASFAIPPKKLPVPVSFLIEAWFVDPKAD
jgi:hypothetical protein